MPTSSRAPARPEPELRYVTEDTARAYVEAVDRGFHNDYAEEHWDLDRRWLDWERNFGFTAGDRWVATSGANARVMTVPGGTVPTAGVTVVTVAPDYRRRGLLTAMMKHQLEDVAHRKEPVALLWASEALIYGRFGYGSCAPMLSLSGPDQVDQVPRSRRSGRRLGRGGRAVCRPGPDPARRASGCCRIGRVPWTGPTCGGSGSSSTRRFVVTGLRASATSSTGPAGATSTGTPSSGSRVTGTATGLRAR